jgi:hypothetical protein
MSTDYVTDRSLLTGRVKRYHTWPTITEQRVGEHCWSVYHIYWRIFGVPSAEVAFFIMHHDAEELVGGDPPFPSKSKYPALKKGYEELERAARSQLDLPEPSIDDYERKRVKICDLLEMMHFGMVEREMGNLLATPIVERTRTVALNNALSLDAPDREVVGEFARSETARHLKVIERQGSTL